MCGIAGIIAPLGHPPHQAIGRMVATVLHRGPDGDGIWSDQCGDSWVALGHTRLAILDLTAAGNQPMCSSDGNYVLIYNGEVYNYLELRTELEACGRTFHSDCDTEVVLQALVTWGPTAFERFNGMWALALFDRREGRLLLARDRMGVKPLYLYQGDGGTIYFASEIKAILAGHGGRFSLNPVVAGRYLQQQQLDAQPETFFEGIRQFPPGSYQWVNLRGSRPGLDQEHRFWQLPLEDGFTGDLPSRIEAVRDLFFDSVRLRLRSDVPVGVLLSGGVDSSSIAVAMQQALGKDADLHALAMVSDDAASNEEHHIDTMVEQLGCAVHKVRLPSDPRVLATHLDRAIYHSDEPLGGFSSIAQYLLMERAKELGITVLLTGQGADELLCGYLKYLGFQIQWLFRQGKRIEGVRLFSSFAAQGTVLRQFSMADAGRYLPRVFRMRQVDIRGPRLRQLDCKLGLGLGSRNVVARQAEDLARFSVPALLHNEDRMSMAHSREMRVPFLDFRLVSLLLPMAPEWKLREGWTKWMFRKALEPFLPAAITWRKDKQGFTTPENRWMAGELSEWIADLLAGEMLMAQWGIIDQASLRLRYARYLSRGLSHVRMRAQDILCPIILELWARRFGSSLAPPSN